VAPPNPRAPGAEPSAAPGAPTPLPVILPTPHAAARASELIGATVVGFDGRPLGSLAELVFPASDEPIALVRRSDDQLACVPMSRLLARLRKPAPEAAAKTPDAGAKEARPAPGAAKLAPTASVDTFIFSENPMLLASAEPVGSAADVDAAAVQRSREHFLRGDATRPPADAGDRKPLVLSELIGVTIKDASGRHVGDVTDVAVNLVRTQSSYLVISTNGRSGAAGKLHGVALDLLSRGEDGSSLVLALTAETVRSDVEGLQLDSLPLQPDLPRPPSGPGS
jgi:sporulation protein YlmC with PRC-barrel domain